MFRWRKALIVARREYLARVKTKAFWISTLAVPAVMLAFTLGPALLMARGGGRHHVGVVTADESLFARIQALITERQRGEETGRLVVTVERLAPSVDSERQRQELKQAILDKRFAAVVFLPGELALRDEELRVEYLSTNVTAFQLMAIVERAVAQAVRERRLAEAGVAENVAKLALTRVDLVPVKVSRGGEERREKVGASIATGYFLMFVMFFTAVMYGSIVMRGVLEEKSSRIVEVIVANLSASELMFGKIFGVGAVGLTQYALWLMLAANFMAFAASASTGAAAVLANPSLMVSFLAFFVLGYFLYGSLFAALGAAFNSEEEAQQIQNVAGWVMAVPFLFMVPVMNNPDSTVSVIVSLIPFFAPMLFFLRMVLQFPPLWQVVLCYALLVATTAFVVRLSAAVYRVGILSYGARPTARQLWNWAMGRS